MAQEIVSRQTALATGLVRYFTGRPCVNGHIAERNAKSRVCTACTKVSVAKHYLNNRQTYINTVKARRVRLGPKLRTDESRRYRVKYPERDRYKPSTRINRMAPDKLKREREGYRDERVEQAQREPPPACETCGRSDKPLVWDHHHSSGKFRGWICRLCNAALGMALDSPRILRALAVYAEDFEASLAADIGPAELAQKRKET